VIQRGAFASTIAAWQASGKRIPLAWNHETGKAEQLIGSVDPATMRETRDGLVAEATLDLEGSATARQAWRSIKSDSIGVSFGYMATESDTGDGTRLLTSIDLYEVSLTATPMHPAARVVSWKSADDELPTERDQRRRLARLMLSDQAIDRDLAAIKAAWDDNRHLLGTSKPRAKSTAPITIKTFEC
jgi:HK97 family phage prohead protease